MIVCIYPKIWHTNIIQGSLDMTIQRILIDEKQRLEESEKKVKEEEKKKKINEEKVRKNRSKKIQGREKV